MDQARVGRSSPAGRIDQMKAIEKAALLFAVAGLPIPTLDLRPAPARVLAKHDYERLKRAQEKRDRKAKNR